MNKESRQQESLFLDMEDDIPDEREGFWEKRLKLRRDWD